jgi:hypothetical protein
MSLSFNFKSSLRLNVDRHFWHFEFITSLQWDRNHQFNVRIDLIRSWTNSERFSIPQSLLTFWDLHFVFKIARSVVVSSKCFKNHLASASTRTLWPAWQNSVGWRHTLHRGWPTTSNISIKSCIFHFPEDFHSSSHSRVNSWMIYQHVSALESPAQIEPMHCFARFLGLGPALRGNQKHTRDIESVITQIPLF